MTATTTADPVGVATARAGEYWFRDGVNEIGMGLGSFGMAGIMYMVHREMATGHAEWSGVAVGLAGLAISLSDGWVRRRLRERFTYPRIGYLSDKGGEPLSRRRKAMIYGLTIVLVALPLVVAAFVVQRRSTAMGLFGLMRWFPLVVGPMMLGAAASDVERFKLPRLWIKGGLLAAAGPAVSFMIRAPFLACAVYSLVAAIVSIASGAVALTSLVRSVPVGPE
jgi:hypothetical protein